MSAAQPTLDVVDAQSGRVLYRQALSDDYVEPPEIGSSPSAASAAGTSAKPAKVATQYANVVDNYLGAPRGGDLHKVSLNQKGWLPDGSVVLFGNNAHTYADINDNDQADPNEEILANGQQGYRFPLVRTNIPDEPWRDAEHLLASGAGRADISVGFGGHDSGFPGDYLATTDASGKYTITGIFPGTYADVYAGPAAGYNTQVRAAVPVTSGTTTLNWQLVRDWTASSAGATVTDSNGPDYTTSVDGTTGQGVQFVKFWMMAPQAVTRNLGCPAAGVSGCDLMDSSEIEAFGVAS